ncbi:hypothetical protein C8R44DRAFT_812919 [Mycena epipterygia]|nr:hypothetical protein C8R44DRAFT_812919 [Mycena epipterygia]
MLDEDDAQTDERLFGRRGSLVERAGPAKKRRVDKGPHERFMDRQSHRAGVVRWEQVYSALMKVQ